MSEPLTAATPFLLAAAAHLAFGVMYRVLSSRATRWRAISLITSSSSSSSRSMPVRAVKVPGWAQACTWPEDMTFSSELRNAFLSAGKEW